MSNTIREEAYQNWIDICGGHDSSIHNINSFRHGWDAALLAAQPAPALDARELEDFIDFVRGREHDSASCQMPTRSICIERLRALLASRQRATMGTPIQIPDYEDAGPEWHRTDDDATSEEATSTWRRDDVLGYSRAGLAFAKSLGFETRDYGYYESAVYYDGFQAGLLSREPEQEKPC